MHLRAWDAEIPAGQLAELGFDPAPDAYAAATEADVCVLANDHAAVAALDFPLLAAAIRQGGMLYDMSGITAGWQAVMPAGIAYARIGNGQRR